MEVGGPFFFLFALDAFSGPSASATSIMNPKAGFGSGGGDGVLDSAAGFGSGGGEGAGRSGGTASRIGNRLGTWAAWHQWDQAALRTIVSGRTAPAETAARNCSADKGPIGRFPSSQNQESLGAEAMRSHHPGHAEPSRTRFSNGPTLARRCQASVATPVVPPVPAVRCAACQRCVCVTVSQRVNSDKSPSSRGQSTRCR